MFFLVKLILLLVILSIILITLDASSIQATEHVNVSIDSSYFLPDWGYVIDIHVMGLYGTISIDIIAEDGTIIDTLTSPATSYGEVQQPFIFPIDSEVGNYTIRAYNSFSTVETEIYVGPSPTFVPLTIITNNPTYTAGETIQVSGEFNYIQNVTSLSISLLSPEGNYSIIPNITTSNNTNYHTSITTGNNTSLSTPGTYTLTSHYGTNTASTTFDYYSHPVLSDNESFIPDDSYLILSDHQISKWTNQITQWENAQNRTDHQIELYYDKLDKAISKNQTDKIEQWTVKIGHSMALSSLYDGVIQCLQEQIELLS